MNKNDGAVQAFFATLTDPTILLELFAILISALVAIALAGFLRAWYRRGYGSAHRSGFSARVLDATVIVLPILLTLGVLFAVYVAFAAKGLGTGLLNRAMQL